MLFSPLSFIYLNVYNKKLERAGESKGGQMGRDEMTWELASPEFMTLFLLLYSHEPWANFITSQFPHWQNGDNYYLFFRALL